MDDFLKATVKNEQRKQDEIENIVREKLGKLQLENMVREKL